LIQALYSDLLPHKLATSRGYATYESALSNCEHYREPGNALKRTLEATPMNRRKSGSPSQRRATDIFIELSSSPRPWKTALGLPAKCEGLAEATP